MDQSDAHARRVRRARVQSAVVVEAQSDAGSAGIFSRWTNQTLSSLCAVAGECPVRVEGGEVVEWALCPLDTTCDKNNRAPGALTAPGGAQAISPEGGGINLVLLFFVVFSGTSAALLAVCCGVRKWRKRVSRRLREKHIEFHDPLNQLAAAHARLDLDPQVSKPLLSTTMVDKWRLSTTVTWRKTSRSFERSLRALCGLRLASKQ
eukprot:1192911-Prorocentrum_minimum.AAC.2